MRLDEIYQMVIARFSENALGAFPRVWQKVQKKREKIHAHFSPVHIGNRG